MYNLLIIEDDDSTRTRYASTFYRKGFQVREAKRLEDAYKLFAAKRPDCILMDLHLPDGYSLEEFYTSILNFQEKLGESPCPIVILTASDAKEDIEILLANGIFTMHSKRDPIDSIEDTIYNEIVTQRKNKFHLIHGGNKKASIHQPQLPKFSEPNSM